MGDPVPSREAAERPARLKVGVIGAGRVGTVLGAALERAGHQVVAVSAVSDRSLERAGRLLPGAAVMRPPELLAAVDLALLTVPDDALPGLVSGLAATEAPLAGRLVAHTSGRHGIAVLEPATVRGALPLALHPVMTFTGRPDDLDRLTGVSFGVTAPEPLQPAAQALVIEMGGEPVLIDEASRPLYHAGLASAANHLVALVAQSADVLRAAGVSDPARMLGPLLSAALDNALRLGDAGLTGPVARGDADTVAEHVHALAGASPEALRAYVALARLTADRALAAGILDRRGRAAPARRAGRSPPMMPIVARTRNGLAAARRTLGSPVVLVPTMGALHEGHRALIRQARELAGPDGGVVVSVFVNPLQFGAGEDLDRYPRTLLADVLIAGEEGADLVFAPPAVQMYPRPQLVTVDPGPVGRVLEGESRPGHFSGVLTVVAKLLQLTRPDTAVFGEKDAQQLALVRRMAQDVDLGVEIVGVPTVRDADGLAISSRNRFLSPAERQTALLLPAALRAGQEAARAGPAAVRKAAGEVLATTADPPLRLDYLALVDPDTFEEAGEDYAGPARLLVAARVGATRLIDNTPLILECHAADD